MAFLICFLSKAFLAWLRSKSRLIILFRERREGGMMNDDVGSWHKTNVAISEDHLWRNRRTTVKAHQRNSQTSFYQIFLSSCLIARLFNSDGNSISIVVTGDAHRHAISRRAVESSSYSSATGRISRTSYKTINNLFSLQHRRIMESRTLWFLLLLSLSFLIGKFSINYGGTQNSAIVRLKMLIKKNYLCTSAEPRNELNNSYFRSRTYKFHIRKWTQMLASLAFLQNVDLSKVINPIPPKHSQPA